MMALRRALCASLLATATAHGPGDHTDGPRYKPEMMDFAGHFAVKQFIEKL